MTTGTPARRCNDDLTVRLIGLAALLAVVGGGAAQAQRSSAQAPTRAGSLILFWSMDPYPCARANAPRGLRPDLALAA